VRSGRTAEFKRFAWQGAVPDPGDPATFVRSRLNHQLANAPRHRELHQFYRRWLAVRRSHPALGTRGKERTLVDLDPSGAVLTVIREAASGPGVRLVANLTGDARAFSAPAGWQVLLDSDDVRFAGRGREPLGPHQAVLYEVAAQGRGIKSR
jgi:maltooligosyltrehalose trehalohydrolase